MSAFGGEADITLTSALPAEADIREYGDNKVSKVI